MLNPSRIIELDSHGVVNLGLERNEEQNLEPIWLGASVDGVPHDLSVRDHQRRNAR